MSYLFSMKNVLIKLVDDYIGDSIVKYIGGTKGVSSLQVLEQSQEAI